MPPPGVTAGGGWNWRWMLFSFQGRAHRAHFWATVGVTFGLMIATFTVLVAAIDPNDIDSEPSGLVVLFFFAAYVLAAWMYLAVAAKRFHDRGKSAAWLFLLLVPFGALWILIEAGFLAGTSGPNSYGPDPRYAY